MDKFRPYNKHKDKSAMFFSVANPNDGMIAMDVGMKEILISYHYIRQKQKGTQRVLQRIAEEDGLFMTDSGVFSFLAQPKPEYYKADYWIPYIEEYVQWLEDNYKKVFVAMNFDLDIIVGREQVERWNEKYFEPLLKKMNLVFVCHKDYVNGIYHDSNGLKRLKEYGERYPYIAVNAAYKDQAVKVYQYAREKKLLIHGLAWTEYNMLKSMPMFSIDSSTWLSGQKYGGTFLWDGRNFKYYDKYHKYVRKSRKLFCLKYGINYEKLMRDNLPTVTRLNGYAWRGMRGELMDIANLKLWNKPVAEYDVKRFKL